MRKHVSRLQELALDRLLRAYGTLRNGVGDETADALRRSVRLSIAGILSGIPPADLAVLGFTCARVGSGTIVRHRGNILPVSGPGLSSLLSRNGIDLLPGDVFLLDPDLARCVIRRALGELSEQMRSLGDVPRHAGERWRLRARKRRLILALRSALESDPVGPSTRAA